MTIEFIGDWPSDLKAPVERVVETLHAQSELKLPADGSINLKLVDDGEIEALNKQYNGTAYATDVLTFHYAEHDRPEEVPVGELTIADVVINTDMAAKQAEGAGTSLSDEVALLALHGVLHSLGLDHGSDSEAAYMDQLQQTVLERSHITYRDFQWTH